MSNKRFWWSVAAVWIVMMGTNWVLHGVWLKPLYEQTAQFWRPWEEMQTMMYWMWIGTAIFSWAFVWIYSKGISRDNQWLQAFRYALAILLVAHVPAQLGMWATSPFPAELLWKWFFIATIQAVLSAFVMTWTYKPLESWSGSKA